MARLKLPWLFSEFLSSIFLTHWRNKLEGWDPCHHRLACLAHCQIGSLGHGTARRGVVAVVREMFARLETGKAADDSIPLDGDDMSILAADDPLAPLHRDGLVAAIVDRGSRQRDEADRLVREARGHKGPG